jgi:hypothetical protein
MAHSPYTHIAIDYVGRNQGCSKYDLASRLARSCSPSKLYYLVNTQIRLGNLLAVYEKGRYYLYTNDIDGRNAMRGRHK